LGIHLSSLGQDRGKNISRGAIPPPGLNVLKRNGSLQPFDKNKLGNSIKNAGATKQQTSLISERVTNRLGNRQTVPSSQLSSMVARSLGQINPAASSQYKTYRDQHLRNPLAPTAKGVRFDRSSRSGGTVFPNHKEMSATPPPEALLDALKKPPTATLGPTVKPAWAASPATPPQPQATVPPKTAPTRPVAPSHQKVGVIRVGVSTNPALKQKVLAELAKTAKPQSTSGSLIDVVDAQSIRQAKVQGKLDTTIIDDYGVTLRCPVNARFEPAYGDKPPLFNIYVVFLTKEGSRIKRTGLLTFKWYRFVPGGTWPLEYHSLEGMEDGYCSMLFRLTELGVYELHITWPGDEKTEPAKAKTWTIALDSHSST